MILEIFKLVSNPFLFSRKPGFLTIKIEYLNIGIVLSILELKAVEKQRLTYRYINRYIMNIEMLTAERKHFRGLCKDSLRIFM